MTTEKNPRPSGRGVVKYKIAIMIHATAAGNRCHAQCRHLSTFMQSGERQTRCAAFVFAKLNLDKDGRILRCRQCITAQKRASRAGHSEAQLPLFGRVA